VLDAEPHHRREVGDDQDDVLRHLRPGDRPHAAEKRAHQDPGQADEHADAELQAREAAGDDADAVDLRHHVGERAQDRGEDADAAHDVAAVARAEKVGDRELAELAQVGGEEKGHQHVAPGPAHHEGEAVEAREVQRPRHADERGRAHPVGAGRHAVEERGHAPARDVVLGRVHRAAHDADDRIQRDGGEQEPVPDPLARHAELLGDGEQDHEGDEAAGVDPVVLLELLVEALVAVDDGAHSSSPSCTPYLRSRLFM
jgi:hypothetical protein